MLNFVFCLTFLPMLNIFFVTLPFLWNSFSQNFISLKVFRMYKFCPSDVLFVKHFCRKILFSLNLLFIELPLTTTNLVEHRELFIFVGHPIVLHISRRIPTAQHPSSSMGPNRLLTISEVYRSREQIRHTKSFYYHYERLDNLRFL